MRVTLGARKHSVKPFWKQETVGKKMQQMFRQEIGLKRGRASAIDFREERGRLSQQFGAIEKPPFQNAPRMN
jgi:hypothetical protein